MIEIVTAQQHMQDVPEYAGKIPEEYVVARLTETPGTFAAGPDEDFARFGLNLLRHRLEVKKRLVMHRDN